MHPVAPPTPDRPLTRLASRLLWAAAAGALVQAAVAGIWSVRLYGEATAPCPPDEGTCESFAMIGVVVGIGLAAVLVGAALTLWALGSGVADGRAGVVGFAIATCTGGALVGTLLVAPVIRAAGEADLGTLLWLAYVVLLLAPAVVLCLPATRAERRGLPARTWSPAPHPPHAAPPSTWAPPPRTPPRSAPAPRPPTRPPGRPNPPGPDAPWRPPS